MALPGQMYINNHMSGSANQIYLALAIEGEEGYDPRIAKMAQWSLANKPSYDLSSDGITFENTKGFIPVLVHMENRTDQYYMGHESPQHGDFQVWADGIPWVNNGGDYLDCSFRNMVLVDGLAGAYAPVSGDPQEDPARMERARQLSPICRVKKTDRGHLKT
jgi:hypothetical protein